MRERRRANSPPPLPPALVRSRLVGDVERMWIEGVLQRSPYHDLLRTLAKPEQLKALTDPWRFQLQENDVPSQPPGTSIGELYSRSAGSLLLLGEEGAGKTTVLLTAARELLNRARADAQQPIPVVLNLSTWTLQQKTLDGWLFAELATRYGVERYHARPWLRADLLVLLLDGLDELGEVEQSSCIEAINLYCLEHPGVQLVVCCREGDYFAQSARLDLRTRAQIQPLSGQQVEAYLDAIGEPAEDIHAAWRTDTGLQTLTQTPLLLTLILLIYRKGTDYVLPIAVSIEEQREQVLAAYVAYRLKSVNDNELYVQGRLEWIAQRMRARSQSVFYLENMQPDWLPTGARRSLSVLFGLIAGLLFVAPVALLVKGPGGLGSGLVAGLVVALFSGLYAWFRGEIKLVDNIIVILRGLRRNIFVWLLGGLLAGVLGISVGGLLYGVIILLLYALAVWAVVGPDDQGQQNRPGGRIWRSGQNGLAIGLLAALGFGLLGVPFAALYIGLIIGVVAGLVAGGSAFIQYFLLRFLLSRSPTIAIPRNLPAFLDYAAERSLLHKVGTGYIFAHRSLLGYFAARSDQDM